MGFWQCDASLADPPEPNGMQPESPAPDAVYRCLIVYDAVITVEGEPVLTTGTCEEITDMIPDDTQSTSALPIKDMVKPRWERTIIPVAGRRSTVGEAAGPGIGRKRAKPNAGKYRNVFLVEVKYAMRGQMSCLRYRAQSDLLE